MVPLFPWGLMSSCAIGMNGDMGSGEENWASPSFRCSWLTLALHVWVVALLGTLSPAIPGCLCGFHAFPATCTDKPRVAGRAGPTCPGGGTQTSPGRHDGVACWKGVPLKQV